VIIHQHIPKCAGTSVRHFISHQFHADLVFAGSLYDLIRIGQAKRDRFAFLSGHYHYGIHRLFHQNAKYLVFLREPISRARSLLSTIYRNKNMAGISVYDFVRSGIDLGINNGMVRSISGELVGFGCCTQEMLSRAKQHLNTYFFIGFVETWNSDMEKMSAAHGWRGRFAQLNKTKHKNEEIYNDDTVYRLLLELNQYDMELYEYAKTI
jgi:hypothetical protein